ncbi:M10 family metallopeptidase C-terminal domain-containing protein [Azohydromonas caseinilytica]|uniref:Peptidase M10 serralysin C-terminal domain-containing protein n=1 Tax=Azohydromonas caseinilytica TaxID=2728836 RepID=A0A848FID4_9BURK|nr:M10 family metallopeptidase C-terminal domain-containing protein [Azohydromonas caseinilytica]NML18906.1 hypothetical protein [Azohydromonas caseinilytica]
MSTLPEDSINTAPTLRTAPGTAGTVLLSSSPSFFSQRLFAQPDGKVYVLTQGASTIVKRFNADGSLDASFNGTGMAEITSPLSDLNHIVDVLPRTVNGHEGITVIDRHGMLTIDGTTAEATAAPGVLDMPFYFYGAVQSLNHTILAVPGSDGSPARYFLAGFRHTSDGYDRFGLMCFDAQGKPVDSFGVDGRTPLSSYGAEGAETALALQADGKVLMAIARPGNGGTSVNILRVNSNGTLDYAFQSGTKSSFATDMANLAVEVGVLSDGKILLVATTRDAAAQTASVELVRLNANGSLDTSFSSDGRTILTLEGYSDFSDDMLVQPNGQIFLIGTHVEGGTSLIHVNADGTVDTGFGGLTATLGSATPLYVENAAPVLLNSHASVFDAELAALDGGAGNYAGATLTLARAGGASAQDLFSGLNGLSLADGQAVLAGVVVGLVTNAGGQLGIAFNGNATQARVNQLLSSIGYANAADALADHLELEWTFNDGSAVNPLAVTETSTVYLRNVNDAPTGEVTISGLAQEGQTLTVSNTLFDADGMGPVTYSWYRYGNPFPIVSGTDSYKLTYADLGKQIFVSASYQDGLGKWEGAYSLFTAAVQVNELNHRPTGEVTITGLAKQGETLSATHTLADADGLGVVHWQWMRGYGHVIEGATDSSYTLTQADVEGNVWVQATYTDALGTVEGAASAKTPYVLNTNDPLTGELTITGTARQGQYLQADTSALRDPDGFGTLYYQWLRDGEAISGATSGYYLLTQADVNSRISVNVSYWDQGRTVESVTSAATAAVVNINDAPVGRIAVSGTLRQGETLTAQLLELSDVDGLGEAASPAGLQWQWLRDGMVIKGATGTSYTLTQADAAKYISVRIGYVDGFGTRDKLESAWLWASNVNDPLTGELTIDGAAVQGQTLTAVTTALDDLDGFGTFKYEWLRDGVLLTNATASTYTLGQADVGKTFSVRVSYVDRFGTAEGIASATTAAVTNVNDAPTGGVTFRGTAVQGQTLTASNTLADADGLGTVVYQWLRDGEAISGATSYSYRLTQADVGRAVSVRASYVDKLGTAEAVTSAATELVANINDAPTGSVTISGTATQNNTLTAATSTLADADGLGELSYQWLRNGVAVDGATASTYRLTQVDVGQRITVQVSYTDGFGAAESKLSTATAAVSNANDLPTGGVSITGTATQGQTLTASHTLDDIDGMGAVSWQWLRAGVAITGATGESYTLAQADVGKAITVKASYVDGFNKAESATSAATAAVANVNDALTGEVAISGTVVQGQTLTAVTTALADADGLGTLKYQWLRDGVAITGATASTYKLAQGDVGKAVTVAVSCVDKLGTAEAVISAATGLVANVNDAPMGSVTLSGSVTQNSTLTAVTSTLADADGLGPLSWQWLRGGVAIDGATAVTYKLTQADVGQAITVRVSYVDSYGTAESKASNPTALVANVNDLPTGGVTISGTAELGSTLTVSHTLSDADGLGTVTYQWLRAGVAITGATGESYTLSAADLDKAISVKASYVDGFNKAESVTSAAAAPVAYPGDTLTGDAGGVATADVLHGGLGASTIQGLAGDDQLRGEGGNDSVYGGTGSDALYGGAGADLLQGDEGSDVLTGGAGKDMLTGGEGSDRFVFQYTSDSGPSAATRDVITDFVQGEDRIDLSALDANTATYAREAFSVVIDAAAAFTAAGQLRLGDGVLWGNTDADADAEFAIELVGVTRLDLSDFVLVR